MAMATQGVCFRNTSAYVTNPTNHVWCDWHGSSYTPLLGVGMVTASNATTADESTTVPAIAGYATFARPQIAQYDLPNGQYTLRLCSGRTTTAVDTNICIWDGGLKDGATQVAAPNLTTYAASTGFSVGQYVIVGDKLYKCTGTGTSGASSPPSGTGSSISDGFATWTWIKTAIFSQFRAASGSVLVDAAGNTFSTYALWNSGNAEYGSPITVTAGFVQITRGQTTQSGVLRYVGFSAVTTPLADLTLADSEGNNLGTTPQFVEKQPAGKLLAKIGVTVGAATLANFSVGGTLTSPTLGGTAATYFQIVQRPGTSELWLASTGVRLPANCTGTLTITQTDNSASISGSPRTTTFTPSFATANGRPTDTSALGLISSECFNQYYTVMSKLDAAWQGYAGQALNGGDVAVTTGAALVTQMTTFAASAGNGKWFRIRLQAGAWDSNITLPEVDFYKDGTGGLLIEPDTGHDPEINAMWSTTALRGVEIKGLLVIGPHAFGTSGTALTKWINSTLPTSTIYNICIVRNCRMGLMFGSSPLTEAEIIGTSESNRTHFWPINFSHGDLVRVLNCSFKGYENAINCSGIRLFESAFNWFDKFIADCHGSGVFSGGAEKKGVLADDNAYQAFHDNAAGNPIDKWDTAGFTFATLLHPDFLQLRSAYTYGEGKSTQQGAWALVGGNFYKAVQSGTGTTGTGTAPSGTGTGQTDGTVTWDWVCTQDNGPRFYCAMFNNILNVFGTSFFDESGVRYSPGIQFAITSDTTAPTGFAVFNNISATKSDYGFYRDAVSNVLSDYIELNDFVGPSVVADTNGGAFSNDVLSDSRITAHGAATASKIKAYKNAVGVIGAGVFDEDNLIISAEPGAATDKQYGTNFMGPFTYDGGGIAAPNGFTVYDMIDGAGNLTSFKQTMARRFTQKGPALGYGAVAATWVSAGGFVRSGGLSIAIRIGL